MTGDAGADGRRREERTDGGRSDDPDRQHLEDVDDGCGCAEVWEHLSERREDAGD